MIINNVNQKAAYAADVKTDAKTGTKAADNKAADNKAVENTSKKPTEDTLTISKDFYKKSKLTAEDSEKVKALKEELVRQTNDFEKFIGSMVAKQGESYNMTLGNLKLNVSQADSAKAAAAVADGGPYSVDAVATRIMDMAKALSGGDASKAEALRDAVKKGFDAAASELGVGRDKMPSITSKTYDEVMKRFDEWGKVEE